MCNDIKLKKKKKKKKKHKQIVSRNIQFLKLAPGWRSTVINIRSFRNQFETLYRCACIADSRYLDFGYLEQPLISRENPIHV